MDWFRELMADLLGDPAEPKRIATPIAELADGAFVRIVGKVVGEETLVAPITGRASVCFDAAVIGWEIPRDARYETYRGGLECDVLVRSLRGVPFVIDDGTGRVHVDPRGATLGLTMDFQRGGRDETDVRIALADPGIMNGVRPRERMLYEEGVIAIDEEVVVVGRVQLGTGDDPALYRGNADRRVHIVAATDGALFITDRAAELERARAALRLPHAQAT